MDGMTLKQQILDIMENFPDARECNLTLYNALCDEYYNDMSNRYYRSENLEMPLFEVIPVVEYLRLLKEKKLPYLSEVIKIRNRIK